MGNRTRIMWLAVAVLGTSCGASAQMGKLPKDTIMVTLENRPCPEGCPEYTLTLIATGHKAGVQYNGIAHVLVTGSHNAPMSAAQVKELRKQLHTVKWGPTAPPTGVVVHVIMSPVSADLGFSSDPALVRMLNEVADSARWVKGNAETVGSLAAESWDFDASDPQHAALLVGAAGDGNLPLVTDLLGAGSRPNARGLGHQLPLFAAIEGHHAEVVRALLQGGADKTLKSPDGETALDMANELGYGDIAAMLK